MSENSDGGSAKLKSLVEQATIRVNSAGEINRNDLVERLNDLTFARVTGIIDPQAVKDGVDAIGASMKLNGDNATTGETPDQVRSNFQKLSIGCARHGGVNRPRFMRVFYNPTFAEDIYGLHHVFRNVVEVRNLIGGMPLDFAMDDPDGDVWTAARIHQYPTGGGFMVAHKDTVLPQMYKETGLNSYFQPILVMSKQGEDFERGGGIVELDGEILHYEKYCDRGDVIIYDASTLHGVDDVDPHLPFRQDSIGGRLSGLVTLYKNQK